MKRTMTAVSCVAIAAMLGLSACGKKTETAATGEPAAASATAPQDAGPLTPPPRKPGLWEQSVSTAGMHQTMKVCLDAAVEQKMKWWGSQASGKSDCAEQKINRHLGGGWDFHSVCKMGESGTITSDGKASGDFNSHYKVEINSTTSGSPMPQANGPHQTLIEATWTGPCPAGVKPGDMQMANGMTVNMMQSMDAAAGMNHGPGGRPSADDIAKMRARALEMTRSQHSQ